MIRIPADELRFHAHSFADPAGRLFWWNGELYRGLHAESAALFRDLLRDGTLERLAEQGLLIDTWPTDFSIDDYEMVVRHRVIPFASYPEEWCPAMLKDAALTLLDLLIELAHCGLTLKDSHPWNLLFDRGRPVYVDLTSITPIRNDHWGGFDEFCRFYRNPLVLMAHNQERIARRLLLEYDGVTEADVSALIRNSIFFRHLGAILKRAFAKTGEKTLGILQSRAAAAGQLRARVEKTKGEIEKIDVPCATSRGVLDCGEIGPQDSWTPTQRLVHELMQRLTRRRF